MNVLHTDGLGSVRAITDSAGTVVQTFATDEFGNPSLTQGTSPEPFHFTGQQRDGESGLYDLRARYYSPGLGRFIERDPIRPRAISTFSDPQNAASLPRHRPIGTGAATTTNPYHIA